jgi:hypothetical protein
VITASALLNAHAEAAVVMHRLRADISDVTLQLIAFNSQLVAIKNATHSEHKPMKIFENGAFATGHEFQILVVEIRCRVKCGHGILLLLSPVAISPR